MKEKERYEFGQRTLFYSGEELTTFDGFNLDDFMRIICKLLNQQDKEIIKLIGENQQLKQSLEYTNRQLDYFTNKFRSREFKRTGDWIKDIELYMKQLAIKELEKALVLIRNAVNLESPEYDLVGLYDAIVDQIKSLKGEE